MVKSFVFGCGRPAHSGRPSPIRYLRGRNITAADAIPIAASVPNPLKGSEEN